jgi:predicted RNA-binding Zn-ribbon protein involved in translation (DUF1610 family)
MNDNLKDPAIDSESEPWQCDACGAEVSFEDKVCRNCGADITEVADDEDIGDDSESWECDACGTEVLFEDKTCRNCGADITEVADGAEDENTRSGNLVTVEDEQSKQPPPSKITKGIIILIVGVALIIISPSLTFTETTHFNAGFGDMLDFRTNTQLKDLAFFGGIAFLVVGGIISALGFSKFRSTQPTTPPAPTTQPVVTQSVSPKSVELGNTPDEVQSVMGQPDKIINLGARVIHVYEDMKIIYVDGKVSDVQLS